MNQRQTINSDNFNNIFKNKNNIIEELASKLTKINIQNFHNNITTDTKNKKKLQYIIEMPNDNTFIITNTKNNTKTIINLKKN